MSPLPEETLAARYRLYVVVVGLKAVGAAAAHTADRTAAAGQRGCCCAPCVRPVRNAHARALALLQAQRAVAPLLEERARLVVLALCARSTHRVSARERCVGAAAARLGTQQQRCTPFVSAAMRRLTRSSTTTLFVVLRRAAAPAAAAALPTAGASLRPAAAPAARGSCTWSPACDSSAAAAGGAAAASACASALGAALLLTCRSPARPGACVPAANARSAAACEAARPAGGAAAAACSCVRPACAADACPAVHVPTQRRPRAPARAARRRIVRARAGPHSCGARGGLGLLLQAVADVASIGANAIDRGRSLAAQARAAAHQHSSLTQAAATLQVFSNTPSRQSKQRTLTAPPSSPPAHARRARRRASRQLPSAWPPRARRARCTQRA